MHEQISKATRGQDFGCTVIPESIHPRASTDPPAIGHFNGTSLAGRFAHCRVLAGMFIFKPISCFVSISISSGLAEPQISHFVNFTPCEELVQIRHFWQM